MLRVRCASSTSPTSSRQGLQSLRLYASTVRLQQLQSRERILSGTHGAGLTNHVSLAQPASNNLPNFVSVAAPAADLFRTKVHEGTGTSERDPYLRTLPNQPSQAPESTVLQSTANLAPTVDEVAALPRKWGTMYYWLGNQHPRLPIFLRQLLISDVPPLSPTAENLLSNFEAVVVPDIAASETDRTRLAQLWIHTVQLTDTLVQKYILDRAAFEAELTSSCNDALEQIRGMALSGQEGVLAVEALRRRAIARRNHTIETDLLRVVELGPYLGFGDALWQVFFRAVESHRVELLDNNPTLQATWEALFRGDAVRLPEVTAPVALCLTLVCVNASRDLAANTAETNASLNLLGTPQTESLFDLVSPTIKRRFVRSKVMHLLDSATAGPLVTALRESGLHELSREVALSDAATATEQQQLEEDVAEAVVRFESRGEVKTLLSALVSGADEAVVVVVGRIFGFSRLSSVDWEAVMQSVDWTNNWRRLATSLLSDPGVLQAVQKLVKNAIGAKGTSRHLFTEEYAEELRRIMSQRESRVLAQRERIQRIAQDLSSHQRVNMACEVLRSVGVDMTELDEAALAVRARNIVERPHITDGVIAATIAAVGARHPNWIRAGVLPSVGNVNAANGMWCLLRMFIRLAYVPQTGAAAIAHRSRRRIGPIGTEAHQFNVPAEVGFVEHYDNLQYKRYDWQGWYQRMVDVHNRNVSLRCRIDDLKRLDAYGTPFVDFQTERRLRILAQDRVGMGVLKLDADKYEDQSDNMTHGSIKLSELLADARKAQLGEEYWPSVEVKVRKPSGQSKMHYSLIDYDRIEKRSKDLYEKYRDAKKRSLFVTPMDMWLDVKGVQVRKSADSADVDGYTVDALQDALSEDDTEKR